MRIFSFIPVLAALVTAVTGVALPRQEDHVARNGAPGLTNAALIRKGLPLKNPIMRRGTAVRRTKPSPSAKPSVRRGVLKVMRQSDGACLGYVSAKTICLTQYKYEDVSSALVVSFQPNTTGIASRLNMITENSDIKDFSYLGLVEGRENADPNLAAGSFQFTYLASTNPTPSGSAPVTVGNSYSSVNGVARTSESAVWNFNPSTGDISAGWVNTDNSVPKVEHFAQKGAICVGGDAAAWFAKFGPAPVTRIGFTFVPI